MEKNNSFIGSTILLSALILSACSGGGDSTSSTVTPPTATPITVTGTAEAPGGMVAKFENNKSYLVAAIEYTFPAAMAAITGLQPVTGATVELIRIDDNGAHVGTVLATTSTSITGDYSLGLPSGVSLAGNLIVRITGNGGSSMSAMVVDQAVNINPVSQFVLDKFIDDDNLVLADLLLNEVVALNGKVDAFDLTATADLSTMLAQLEAEVGQFVNNEIAVIEATPDDGTAAALVAGAWHTAEFSIGMHDLDAGSSGSFAMDVLSEEITLTNNSGSLDLTIGTALIDTFTNLYNNNFTSANIYHQISLGEAGDIFPATIDANGNITLTSPFEEELQTPAPGDLDGPDLGWRWPPNTDFIFPVANGNTYVTTFSEADVMYETIDTDNDGIKDAINPAARLGDNVDFSLFMMLKAGNGMDVSSVSGDYGIVALNINVDTAPESIYDSTVGVINFDPVTNGGEFTQSVNAFDVEEVVRLPAVPPMVSLTSTSSIEPSLAVTNPYTVSATGQVTLDPAGDTLEGFTNSDGSVIAFVDDLATGSPNITNVNNEMLVAVKLGTSMTTSLNAATYKLFPLILNTSSDGVSEIFTMNSTATFSADSATALIEGTDWGVERISDVAQVESFSELVMSGFTVDSIAGNGEIVMSETENIGGNTYTTTLKGYVSADSNLLIMRVFRSNQVAGSEYDLGMIIGVKQ